MKTCIRTTSAVAGLVLLAGGATAPTILDMSVLTAAQDSPGAPPPPRQPPPLAPRGALPPGARGGGQAWVEETFNGKAKLGARSTVDLVTLRGDITINGIDGDVVRVAATKRVLEPNKEYARTVLQNLRVRVTERGGGVEVLTEVPEGRLPPFVVNYVIGVPYASNVSFRSYGGAIRVENVKGELRAEAYGGGDMVLSSVGRIRVAKSVAGNVSIAGAEGDDVTAETLTGRLQIREVRARSVELRSISGGVFASDLLCDRCAINTVNGNIELTGPLKPEGRYSLNTQSGDIKLTPTGTVSFDLEAMTSGNLTNEFPLRRTSAPAPAPGAQRRFLRGVVGSGSSILSLASFTGNVSILRKADGR